jgi:hypothetical protein
MSRGARSHPEAQRVDVGAGGGKGLPESENLLLGAGEGNGGLAMI